jgi:flagellar biosynthesis repressor protein FlbT
MPLKLSLKPGEKFVLNGAVVQNGDRRSALLLQNKASVLREKDIMQFEEATTPSRRIYFPVMMMYLDQADWERYQDAFVKRLSEFMGAVQNALPQADRVRRRKVGECRSAPISRRRTGLRRRGTPSTGFSPRSLAP